MAGMESHGNHTSTMLWFHCFSQYFNPVPCQLSTCWNIGPAGFNHCEHQHIIAGKNIGNIFPRMLLNRALVTLIAIWTSSYCMFLPLAGLILCTKPCLLIQKVHFCQLTQFCWTPC